MAKQPVLEADVAEYRLKFSMRGNSKLEGRTASFSLPAGFSCPGAVECKTFADRKTGRITDGKKQRYRCFSASEEAAFPSVRAQRWHNFDLVRDARYTEGIYQLLMDSLPKKTRWDTMRIHVGGDYYTLSYFAAWMEVARAHPDKKFYAYTKSVPIIEKWLQKQGALPENFALTSSAEEIEGAGHVEVVFHPDEAKAKGREIDHDDSHALTGSSKFALLIHGTQPAGSDAAAAKKQLKNEGVTFSYPRKTTSQ